MSSSIPAFNQTQATPNINPLDAQLAADPNAATLWNKVRGNFTTLAGAFDTLTRITNQLFADLAAIEANTRLTTAAKASDVTATRNQAQQDIEALRGTCETARANALAAVSAAIGDNTPFAFAMARNAFGDVDFTKSQMALSLTQDAWDRRIKPVLDMQQSASEKERRLMKLAGEANEQKDQYAVAACRQYGASYLAAHGITTDRRAFVHNLNVAIGANSAPVARAAAQIEDTLAMGWNNLQGAFLVALGYAKGSSTMRVQGLAGWPGFPTINL